MCFLRCRCIHVSPNTLVSLCLKSYLIFWQEKILEKKNQRLNYKIIIQIKILFCYAYYPENRPVSPAGAWWHNDTGAKQIKVTNKQNCWGSSKHLDMGNIVRQFPFTRTFTKDIFSKCNIGIKFERFRNFLCMCMKQKKRWSSFIPPSLYSFQLIFGWIAYQSKCAILSSKCVEKPGSKKIHSDHLQPNFVHFSVFHEMLCGLTISCTIFHCM